MPWLLAAPRRLGDADRSRPPMGAPVGIPARPLRREGRLASDGSEILPLPDDSADAVTSFSVIEHMPDKARAMAEDARILKPGAPLFISFDICEPAMGMTFPEWNGRALTLAEFEREIWLHPAFGNRQPPRGIWMTFPPSRPGTCAAPRTTTTWWAPRSCLKVADPFPALSAGANVLCRRQQKRLAERGEVAFPKTLFRVGSSQEHPLHPARYHRRSGHFLLGPGAAACHLAEGAAHAARAPGLRDPCPVVPGRGPLERGRRSTRSPTSPPNAGRSSPRCSPR